MKKTLLLLIALLSFSYITEAQNTYTNGTTEYYTNQTYSSTGNPKVKRSEANKEAFLDSLGHKDTPEGYEIDHIIALVDGGSDDKSNMQLLTVEEHKKKTAKEATERARKGRTIHTGPNGGKYYINKNGNKTYVKMEIQLKSIITCPKCDHKKEEELPTTSCLFVYECENCSATINPKAGDCCVFCSYGTNACPSIQQANYEKIK